MAEGTPRLRIILRMVQIHDNLEPAWKDEGGFRFTATVSTGDGVHETVLPPPESDMKFYKVMDNPAWNRLMLDKTLYEGPVGDRLEIEILGEEFDTLSSNDQLVPYRRVFEGDPATWIGFYHPGDEGSSDPERMSNWWVYLEVEAA